MATITAFLSSLGLGALLLADALLPSERLARAGQRHASLWWAHAGHVLLAQLAFLFFGWTRLHFSPASAPHWGELALLALVWSAIHMGADVGLRPLAAECVKLLSLVPAAWLLQLRHTEWTALAQGPILFLGQQTDIGSFALNTAIFFGLCWAGLAWRDRRLAGLRLGLAVAFGLFLRLA